MAIYTKVSVPVITWSDLSIIDNEVETIWIEIKNSKFKNILCFCAYRYPSSNLMNFREHIETIICKIANKNKNIFVMGDFNLNLLNYESHPETNDFLNTMSANFLFPYILQPTRITDRFDFD